MDPKYKKSLTRYYIRMITAHVLMWLFAIIVVVVTGAAAYRAGVQDGYEQGRSELNCSPIRYTTSRTSTWISLTYHAQEHNHGW